MTEPLTEAQLTAIAARANAAEDGWHLIRDTDDVYRFEIHGNGPTHVAVFGGDPDDMFASYPTEENALFAVHARTDVPALLGEVDRLRAERDRYRAAWRSARHRAQDLGEALVMTLDETTLTQAHADYARVDAELTAAEQQRDGAYRERAQLLAWLAATHPAVLAPAPDVDEPGWQILYLTASGHQLSWHIHPRDAELFAHVEQVAAEDPRAQWDGHTTDEKYQHIRTLTEDGAE